MRHLLAIVALLVLSAPVQAAIDAEGRWLRADQLAEEIAAVASAELGRQFIDGKVEVAVARIREVVGR